MSEPVHTILIRATRQATPVIVRATRANAPVTVVINRGPPGPEGPIGPAGAAGADGADGEDGASDVGDLTTDGLTPGEVLVVDNPSGVTTLALGTAALVNTGTGATNAILGNDSRLTDPRTPNDHTHGYTDLLPESEEFAVSSSVYFDGSNNLTLTSQDSHRLRIGTDDMVGYSGVLQVGSAPTAGTVVIVWNARTDTTTVKNANDETLGTIATGNCGLLTSNGSIWTFASFGQRALLTLAEISPLPIANGGTGAATAPLALAELGGGATGTQVFAADDAPTALSKLGTLATASPNDTVNSFTLGIPASGFGSTNVAVNIQPKGTGAFYLGPVADGTSTGGDPRGKNAVDLQLYRSNKIHIASGEQSFCAGGMQNKAPGLRSMVLGGDVNIADAYSSLVVLGSYSKAENTANYGIASGPYCTVTRHGEVGRTSARLVTKSVFFTLGGKTLTDSAVDLALDGDSIKLTCSAGTVMSGTINVHGMTSDGSVVAHYMRQFSIRNQANVVTDVAIDGSGVITLTSPHGLAVNDAVRITGGVIPTASPAITLGQVLYVESVPAGNTLTLKRTTDGALITFSNAGSGTRTMSSTKLLYAAYKIGDDLASGTTLAVSAVTVAGTTLADYLSIAPTGLAATATPVTGCVGEVDDVITKTGHGLTDTTPVILTSLTGGAGLTLNTVVYYIKNKTDDTFNLATTSGGTVANILTKYTDMTVQPANVMRWTAHVSAVETAYGT